MHIGAWKNYEELEESLTLDELIWTNDAIYNKEKNEFKINAALAGADIGDLDDDDSQRYAGDLPEELLEAERKLNQFGSNEFAGLGSQEGSVSARYMTEEEKQRVQEMVKGLG